MTHNVLTIAQLQPGAQFCYAAIDWNLQDATTEKALCLMATQSGPMPFDDQGRDDYRAAGIRGWLENHFMKILLTNGARKSDFLPLQLDLSRDGQSDSLITESGIGLLSWRQVQRYHDLFSETEGFFWTCTRTKGHRGAGLIAAPGGMNSAFGYFRPGDGGVSVRPAVCLRPDVFVTGR